MINPLPEVIRYGRKIYLVFIHHHIQCFLKTLRPLFMLQLRCRAWMAPTSKTITCCPGQVRKCFAEAWGKWSKLQSQREPMTTGVQSSLVWRKFDYQQKPRMVRDERMQDPHAGAAEKAESSWSSSNTGGDRDGKDDPVGDMPALIPSFPLASPPPFPTLPSPLSSLPVPSSFFFLLFFPFPLLPSSYLFYETGEWNPGTCSCRASILSPSYTHLIQCGCS